MDWRLVFLKSATMDRRIPYNATVGSFTYYDNGNIHTSSRVETYSYGTSQPHAVTSITSGVRPAIPSSQCDVTYNLRNRPATLLENGYNNGISS